MDAVDDPPEQGVAATAESEMTLIRVAIEMVATGGAPRVMVAGVGYGEEILVHARRLALEAGVRLRPVRRADDRGADVVIERIRR